MIRTESLSSVKLNVEISMDDYRVAIDVIDGYKEGEYDFEDELSCIAIEIEEYGLEDGIDFNNGDVFKTTLSINYNRMFTDCGYEYDFDYEWKELEKVK